MNEISKPFQSRVQASLARINQITSDARILVGLSGGADSMALLEVMRELGYAVDAAHVDHCTRDGASTEDAAFVRDYCAANGIRLHESRVDVPKLAEDSPLSFEEVARDARYLFFTETAKGYGLNVIATAHHADDQAETVLMRVLRGTSPRGVAGIPPITERDGVRIIRPLLEVTRPEILDYLQERGIPYREDETNLDPGFLRNRIRHELLPRLRHEYNTNIREALNRLAVIQRDEDDYLKQATNALLAKRAADRTVFQRSAFAQAHRALQRRAVLEVAWTHNAFPEFERVDAAVDFILEAASNKRFDLGSGVQLVSGPDGVTLSTGRPEPLDTRAFPLPVPGEAEAFGERFSCRRLEGPPPEALSHYCTSTRQVFDADVLTKELTLRHRRDGDRIAPLGMEGTRKLKDYFHDIGMRPEDRDRAILLTGDGEVLWVVGGAASRKAAVTEKTRHYAEVTVDR
jgi:tRNA(Ile)-lysidine synthase